MSCWKSGLSAVCVCVYMQLRRRRSKRCWLEAELIGWGSLHNGASRFTPGASCVPCHVVYTNIRSCEEQSARRMNYKSDTDDNLPSSFLQRAAPEQNNNNVGGGPRQLRTEPLSTSSEQLVATDLQSCSERHREVRFLSGSTCWKTTNAFSPLGSTSAFSLYLSRALALGLNKNNTVSYFPRPKWFNVRLSLTKAGSFVFIHSWHTSPTYSFPLLYLPVSFHFYLCLDSIFPSLAQFLSHFCIRPGNIYQELQIISP